MLGLNKIYRHRSSRWNTYPQYLAIWAVGRMG
jgi:hypothetical protein